MNILHATTDPTLLTRLRQMLSSAQAADIAVGYLFVSGFAALADELERLDRVRILVGRTDRPTLEEVALGVQQAEALQARLASDDLVQRRARSEIGARAVEVVGQTVAHLAQTDVEEQGVHRLSALIAGGRLQIKTYPRGVLHAKAYLCWYQDHAEPGSAIVGSSNFTLAGFTGNTELNVRVTGDAEMAELKRWFEALWTDAIDVTVAIAVELRRSWALATTPPYHVYLKALYELYGDQLYTPELIPGRRDLPELANFQLDAVRRGLAMIDQHGGCFIGDVVGLGKTYVGGELVRQLQFNAPAGSHPLIICPAGLKPMWEHVSERFRLGAVVVSMSAIRPPAGTRFDEATESYVDEPLEGPGIDLIATYPNRGVVLVDEAHNFRNPDTRRYLALEAYLRSADHTTILLSATPQNLGPADIYHQIRLFLDDLDHGLPLEPIHLRDYFSAAQRWYASRLEFEEWQQTVAAHSAQVSRRGGRPAPVPQEPAQPTVPPATIEQVLNPVFVRRRRRDIRELYGDDLTLARAIASKFWAIRLDFPTQGPKPPR